MPRPGGASGYGQVSRRPSAFVAGMEHVVQILSENPIANTTPKGKSVALVRLAQSVRIRSSLSPSHFQMVLMAMLALIGTGTCTFQALQMIENGRARLAPVAIVHVGIETWMEALSLLSAALFMADAMAACFAKHDEKYNTTNNNNKEDVKSLSEHSHIMPSSLQHQSAV
ncbi:unnamed protein product [Sphagnum balticum]